MKCGQAEKWMDAALDERSGGTEHGPAGGSVQRRAEFEMHLAACPNCRRQWEVLRSAEAVLRVPKPVPAPEGLLADFRQRLADEERPEAHAAPPPRRATWGWRWLWPVGSLAAAGVAAAAVLMFNIQPPMSSVQEIQRGRQRGSAANSPATSPNSALPSERLARAPKLPLTGTTTAPTNPERAKPKLNQMAGAKKSGESEKIAPPALRHDRSFEASSAGAAKGLPRSLATAPPSKPSEPRQGEQASPHPTADPIVAERQLARQGAPGQPEPQLAGKPTFAREPQGLTEKLSTNVRPQADSSLGLQKQTTVAAATTAPAPVPSKPQNLGVLYGSNNSQIAQNNSFYYAQVPAEPTPVELNVSAAVLNALQRPVELRSTNVRVQDLAEQLATEADVEVKVDPKVAQLNVTVNESGAPLWRLLEDVARQAQVQIYPRDNSLELRPSKPVAPAAEAASNLELKVYTAPKAKADSTLRARGLQPAPKAVGDAPVAPAAPAGPAGPRGPVGSPNGGFGGMAGGGGFGRGARGFSTREEPAAPNRSARYAYSNRRPDRKIWPAAWGNLPERGFEVPTAEELPPLILAPVQSGTTLTNEVPQIRARKETESETRTKAELKFRQQDSKKLPAHKKPGQ